jgi:plasmid stabilization system protein ParE
MMRIIFRKEAEDDLRDIVCCYENVAPGVDQLAHFPHLGMQVEDRQYRRIVTLKYHFKVAYEVGEDRIIILGIFRYQDREF